MPWPREELTRIRLATGELAGAIEVFQSLEVIPDDAALLTEIGLAYESLNRLSQASVWLERALEIGPAEPSLLEHMGNLQVRMNEIDSVSPHKAFHLQNAHANPRGKH